MLAQRGALRLKQRTDEERVLVELHCAHAALVIARRNFQRPPLQPIRVQRIEAIVAAILFLRRIAAVDGSQTLAGLENQPTAHIDQ